MTVADFRGPEIGLLMRPMRGTRLMHGGIHEGGCHVGLRTSSCMLAGARVSLSTLINCLVVSFHPSLCKLQLMHPTCSSREKCNKEPKRPTLQGNMCLPAWALAACRPGPLALCLSPNGVIRDAHHEELKKENDVCGLGQFGDDSRGFEQPNRALKHPSGRGRHGPRVPASRGAVIFVACAIYFGHADRHY